MSNDWLNVYTEVVNFGGVLLAVGELPDAEALQYYYEKPHKYTPEHESWVAAGRPDEFPAMAEWIYDYHAAEVVQ
jgi:hypothetical protein